MNAPVTSEPVTSAPANETNPGPLVAAGLLLGTGLGGFVDGIVLHQILQWHDMLSTWRPPTTLVDLKVNMVWDGLFHAGTWSMTVAGVILLFRAGKRADVPWSGRVLLGAVLAGWGLFDVVEGVIDHEILGVHHVHPGSGELGWDLGFLGFGLALMVLGVFVMRWERRAREPRAAVAHGEST
jgi:uncharacterized membrane protein